MSSKSPEQAYLSLIASEPTDADSVTALFDKLKPIPPSFLLGDWLGGHFPTLGHPVSQLIREIKWAGKHFHSEDDVDPIIVYDEQGKRVWSEEWGHAKLHGQVEYRGVPSASMVYEAKPIMDYFRYVNEDVVAGIMESKDPNLLGGFHFYLKRYKPEM
ncbi:GXWXG protein-domain-containing protein [Roridomyces roridus]|uniref:GXWXG protein-domain-containing protein n=1 Tax=Roridomyces roridus TaxID=1738132 RepID=A0AAD7B325_9AGAR|nr:GXWXG protein-domain-containing protein [Roridomyces roridus]